ncbi:hypothetical protein [Kocuria sp. HSID16901]|uniref:hypothetical protein n=1 Tax=Kocuria sp. HSID16901 TaxID=2419505 RepID=UPI000F86614F|nr:hypothetical protein [Kocuria sp. HSID16901]RUQ22321.1 hypothetical protein D8M21_02375 [Kocuria sp. HSID16901]
MHTDRLPHGQGPGWPTVRGGATLRARMPGQRLRVPQTLFIGLPGRIADAVTSLAVNGEGLPWLLDRTAVNSTDLLAESYRPFHRERPRSMCLEQSLVALVPEVLSRSGVRPEDRYLSDLCRDETANDLRQRLHGLVLRPDVVVWTAWAGQREEWNVPVAPDVRCLQLFHDTAARVTSWGVVPWAKRRCGDCLEALASTASRQDFLSVEEIVTRIISASTRQPEALNYAATGEPPVLDGCSCWWGGF